MSTTINPTHSSVPGNARTSAATSHAHPEYPPNGHHHHHHDTGVGGKKGKQKKASDPNEDAKMIQAKIAQLELDAAEGKDQEAEIGMFYLLASTRCAKSLGFWGPPPNVKHHKSHTSSIYYRTFPLHQSYTTVVPNTLANMKSHRA